MFALGLLLCLLGAVVAGVLFLATGGLVYLVLTAVFLVAGVGGHIASGGQPRSR